MIPVSTACNEAPSSTRKFATRTALLTLTILLAGAQASSAQAAADSPGAWELRATSGWLVATGAQRSAVKDAQLSALQVSWLVRPSLALTGTFDWARSRDLLTTDHPKLDVFSYDLGVEARASEWFADRAVTFLPFVGAGAGGRSYNYRSLEVDATHDVAAYATAGGEFGMRRVGLRLEVRDYVTGFKPLTGSGVADRRNDVVIMLGLRLKKAAAPIAP